MLYFPSEPEGLRARRAVRVVSSSPSLNVRVDPMSQLKQCQRVEIISCSAIYSFQASKGLDETDPHWGEKSVLLKSTDSSVISSRNIVTDTPRNGV